MTVIPRRVRLQVLARSLLVQASFNYRTLIGMGFAFVLAPGLRHLHHGSRRVSDDAIARHAEVFNAHPYFVPLAAGAILRLEADQVDASTISRFKSALRSSLGSLGDRLFWAGWRPATALVGLGLLLLGLPSWSAVLAFLVLYNALHLWARAWGLRTGLRQGLQVAAALRSSPLARWAELAAGAGAFLAGSCAVLAVGRVDAATIGYAIGAAAVILGSMLGYRVREAAGLVLGLVWAVAAATLLLSRT